MQLLKENMAKLHGLSLSNGFMMGTPKNTGSKSINRQIEGHQIRTFQTNKQQSEK